MTSLLFTTYGVASYLAFLATFLYMIGFVAGLPLPRTIDLGPSSPADQALAIDAALIAVFGIQHSVMARASFKRVWTRIVAPPIERSTFVLASTAALALILWQWRPIAGPVVWHASGTLAWALAGLMWLGWAMALASTFMIDHFELVGLSQVLHASRRTHAPAPRFRTPMLYRYVRHPLYAGLLLGIWASPHMTAGHLLLAAGFTAYIFVGIHFEERDLLRHFGAQYANYRREVGMVVPKRRKVSPPEPASPAR